MKKLINVLFLFLFFCVSVNATALFNGINSGDILKCCRDAQDVYLLFNDKKEDSAKIELSGLVYDKAACDSSSGIFRIVIQKSVPARVVSCSDRFKRAMWLDSIVYNDGLDSVKFGLCYPMLSAGENYHGGDFFRLKIYNPAYNDFGVWFTFDSSGSFSGSFGGENCTQNPPHGSGCFSFGTAVEVRIRASGNIFCFSKLTTAGDADFIGLYLSLGATGSAQQGGFVFTVRDLLYGSVEIKNPDRPIRPFVNSAVRPGAVYYNLSGRKVTGNFYRKLNLMKISGKTVKILNIK